MTACHHWLVGLSTVHCQAGISKFFKIDHHNSNFAPANKYATYVVYLPLFFFETAVGL